MAQNTISMSTLLRVSAALTVARHALAAAPGSDAWAAYLDVVKAESELETRLGFLEPVEIEGEFIKDETKTANPVRLAA